MSDTNAITQMLLEGLTLKGYYAWRQNTRVSGGRLRCTSKEGISDICAVSPAGRFVAVEVKRKGEPLRDTQKDFMQEMLKRHVLYFICRSPDKAKEFIELL